MPTTSRLRSFGPYLLVGATVLFCLIVLRAEATPVAYLNDGAIHSEMVRFATARLRSGHLPLTSWFPYLGEGSPLFLHYQSLGATLAGVLGLVVGPNTAYAWTLYLLLATWPIAIFCAMRLFGFDRWTAAFAAVCSPFVISVLGIGYEQQSYLSLGYGLWSQLFAMWTLPLAWGWSWRALQQRRALAPATLFVSATIAFHFETGYLAVFGLLVAFVAVGTPLRARCRRLIELVFAVALSSAWVIVPLLRFRTWTSINEFLQHGPDVNSYGARQALSWLIDGQLFDAHRFPVLTILVIAGLVVGVVACGRDRRCRMLLGVFVISLALFFGRTTFGSLFNLLPGSTDLFLRRFLMGVQLAGIFLCGIALAQLARGARTIGNSMITRYAPDGGSARVAKGVAGALGLLLLIAYLAPCWSQIASIDQTDAQDIAFQNQADSFQGAEIAPLLQIIERDGGRVYAGLPVPDDDSGGWGSNFDVGEVPVFKYLTEFDIDEVGYTLRTASLMTDPEVYFDENDPSDYPLFGVHWLLYPTGRRPVVAAKVVLQRGDYTLWELSTSGYLQVIDTEGTIDANRANLGMKSADFVRSNFAGIGRYPTVDFPDTPAARPTLTRRSRVSGLAGTVLSSSVDLANGSASATVVARRRAVVLLKVSYDPGWHVLVDGRPAPTEMIAPAYVGVTVPAGRHHVQFAYQSGADELLLLPLAAVGLAIVVACYLWERRRLPDSVQTAP